MFPSASLPVVLKARSGDQQHQHRHRTLYKCTFSGPAQQVRGMGVEQPSSGDHLGSTLPFTMEARRLSQDSPDFLQQTWAGDTVCGRGSGKAFAFSTVREQQGCCRLPSVLCPQASRGTTAIWRPGSHSQYEDDDGAGRHRVPGLKALPELLLHQPSSALPGLPNGELLNLYLFKPLWVWFSITFSQMHS